MKMEVVTVCRVFGLGVRRIRNAGQHCVGVFFLIKSLSQQISLLALARKKFLRWRPEKSPKDCTLTQVKRENRSALDLL